MLYPRRRKSAKAPVIKFQVDPEKEKSELKKITLTLFAKAEDLMKSGYPIQVNISFRIPEILRSLEEVYGRLLNSFPTSVCEDRESPRENLGGASRWPGALPFYLRFGEKIDQFSLERDFHSVGVVH